MDTQELLDTLPSRILVARLMAAAGAPPTPGARWRFWQVEALLNQAADILDRCADIKKETDELWIREVEAELLNDREGIQTLEDQCAYADVALAAQLAQELNSTINQKTGQQVAGAIPYNTMRLEPLLLTAINDASSAESGLTGRDSAARVLVLKQVIADFIRYTYEQFAAHAGAGHTAAQRIARQSILDQLIALRNKRVELSRNANALDFKRRRDLNINNRLLPDLVDARERAVVARDGLVKIFGWADDTREVPVPNDPLGSTYIEDLTAWVADAIRYLVRFSHTDQGFTVTVALGPLLADGAPVEFTLPPWAFKKHEYVRLRGLSAFAQSTDLSAVFNVELKAPTSAVYIRERTAHKIQQDCAPCRLGRVTSRASARSPEIGGTTSLINVSPIPSDTAKWSVSVWPVRGAALQIENLEIELGLIGQPI